MDFLASVSPLFRLVTGFRRIGVLVGMTGVGGGSADDAILLILLFNVNPVTAVGTDLIYASITKTGGSLVLLQQNHRLAAGAQTGLGSLPASGGHTGIAVGNGCGPRHTLPSSQRCWAWRCC